MALRRESTALPMLDDGESSNTKFGLARRVSVACGWSQEGIAPSSQAPGVAAEHVRRGAWASHAVPPQARSPAVCRVA